MRDYLQLVLEITVSILILYGAFYVIDLVL